MTNPCSICGAKPRGKAATVYWRWQATPNDWERYKGRYCATCFIACILPVYQAGKLSTNSDCVEFGEASHDPVTQVTYATLYTPKSDDAVNFEVWHCMEHLPAARRAMVRGAEPLSATGGSGTGRPEPDPWEALPAL